MWCWHGCVSSSTSSCEGKTAYKQVRLTSMLRRLRSTSPWHEMMHTDAKASVGTHALCCHETLSLTASGCTCVGCTCVKDCYLQSAVASNDCRGPSPLRQSVEEGQHASCHGCAHGRATAAHLQQEGHQKGSDAAVPITWTNQT